MLPAAGELDSGQTCRNCGQGLAAGRSVCERCGAAHGEANRCPHCDAIADIEAHAALGFRCLVCGGPRVSLGLPQVSQSQRTREALKAAGGEQTKHIMFSAAGLLLASMGALALVIATVVVLAASPGALPTLATYFAAAVPLAAGLLALSRAATARKLRSEALRSAQISALCDLQSVVGPLDEVRAAELMRLSPERAQLLLAEASVATLLAEVPAPRLRVDAPEPTLLGDEPELSKAAAEANAPAKRTVAGETEP